MHGVEGKSCSAHIVLGEITLLQTGLQGGNVVPHLVGQEDEGLGELLLLPLMLREEDEALNSHVVDLKD